jgi:RNA polymerase sigma factor (TIGR02999 family)
MEVQAGEAIPELMDGLRRGDRRSAERLVEILYPELKRLALNRMRMENAGHTLQPTALVNELYLELTKIREFRIDATRHAKDDRTAFLALAALIMKRLLIHHARPLSKRALKVPIEECTEVSANAELRELDDALDKLAAVDPKLRRVVEMKIFEGRSSDEMAAMLGCTTRSIERYWNIARGWLREYFE